ncbi:MAG: outer membrane protein transport protein [Myxococcales bacterium]|nr:outer membrane protein transport protein [Myxococcales bacterium]
MSPRAAGLATLCAACLVASVPRVAHASPAEDLQGLHARANAMGGAGTALYGDFSAVYYNPAALSRCPNSQLTVGARFTTYDLHPSGQAVRSGALGAGPSLPFHSRLSIGTCEHLPAHLTLGFAIGMEVPNVIQLELVSPDAQPRFVEYGANLQGLTALLGVAYRVSPELALGAGVSVLATAGLGDILALIPVPAKGDTETPRYVRFRIPGGVRLSFAPIASVLWSPRRDWHLGLTYRGELYFGFDGNVNIVAPVLSIVDVRAQMRLQQDTWYSPHQIAVGVSHEIRERWTVAADLTWYHYSAFESRRLGPFMHITVRPPDECQNTPTLVSCMFVAPPSARYGYRDIVAPRAGAEVRLLDGGRLSVRGGYGFRPAVLAAPNTKAIGNLLDANVHSFSAGVGYRFGPQPNDVATATAERRANGAIDAYGRASVMQRRNGTLRVEDSASTTTEGYSFGGAIYAFGLDLTLGWF